MVKGQYTLRSTMPRSTARLTVTKEPTWFQYYLAWTVLWVLYFGSWVIFVVSLSELLK